MAHRIEVVEVHADFGPAQAAALAGRVEAALAAGARWVAVDLGAWTVDGPALAEVARRQRVVVCGGPDALRRELAGAGVVATRRLLDVEVAARAAYGDGLKRRLELLELPRMSDGP